MGDSLEETETEYYLKMCYTSRNGDVGKYKYMHSKILPNKLSYEKSDMIYLYEDHNL